MATKTEICNTALQKIGAGRITSISQDTNPARVLNALFDIVRQSELRQHPWSFAITRTSIAADAEEPEFGKAYSYTLPALCLRVLPPYPEMNLADLDWEIEGRQIYTDETAPLYLRYIQDVTDTAQWDALFVDAFATKLAFEACEELTQSNSKKEGLRTDYDQAIKRAKRTNAIERTAQVPPDDSWVTVRA